MGVGCLILYNSGHPTRELLLSHSQQLGSLVQRKFLLCYQKRHKRIRWENHHPGPGTAGTQRRKVKGRCSIEIYQGSTVILVSLGYRTRGREWEKEGKVEGTQGSEKPDARCGGDRGQAAPNSGVERLNG